MVCLVIPALNEEAVIASVVASIPRDIVDQIFVVDNGSTDATAAEAGRAGAIVVPAPTRGYGRACRAGAIAALRAGAKIVAFIDGDGSDCPEFIPQIVGPILQGEYDFVIGSRVRGQREPGSMNTQQLLAGFLAGRLIRFLYGVRYTDMSPFRAIRAELLPELDLREETYGWNLEMQMLVAQRKLRILEIPVDHRNRQGGESKVSGTFRGTVVAGYRILQTFGRVACTNSRRTQIRISR
jgi:glycosyltransferase involved in cell wall biosynthesis